MISNSELFKYIFILMRLSGLFIFAPFFSSRVIPAYIKAGLVFMLTVIIGSALKINIGQVSDYITLTLIVIKEFSVGLAIGLVSSMIFNSLYVAGEIIDMEMGFGMVNFFDPFTQSQKPITGTFINYLALIIYLVINGHHRLIEAVILSYKFVPVRGITFNHQLTDQIVKVFGDMFILGIKISAPVLIAIMLTDICLAILSRIVPQMNVFINGFPLKILLGFGVLMLMLPMFLVLLDVLFGQIDSNNLKILHLM